MIPSKGKKEDPTSGARSRIAGTIAPDRKLEETNVHTSEDPAQRGGVLKNKARPPTWM